MTTIEKTTNQTIEQIAALINGGIEKWIEAGKLVAKAIDEDPGFVDKFCSRVENISPEVLFRFEQIGRNKVYPYLLLNDSPGVRALRSLPIEHQKKYWHEPVKMLVLDNGKAEELAVDVRAMTKLQAKQVFSASGVRSSAAQRAWIEDYKLRSAPVSRSYNPPWRVVGNKVVFSEPCTLSAKDLARIMEEVAS